MRDSSSERAIQLSSGAERSVFRRIFASGDMGKPFIGLDAQGYLSGSLAVNFIIAYSGPRSKRKLIGLQQSRDLLKAPNVIGGARLHHRSNSQRFVYAPKVVILRHYQKRPAIGARP